MSNSPQKTFDREIVSGSIARSVWKLAWPMTLLNLVNGLHGMVDHLMVGNFIHSESNAANAAIGVSWQVFLVVVVLISSLFQGMNVLLARYAGRQERDTMSRIAYQVFITSVAILVFIFGPIGYFVSPALLRFVNAEGEVFTLALSYMRILFIFGSPLFMMFMVTGALQASGEPKTPLKLGLLTTVLHIIISSVLITGVGPFPRLGVVGAAIGTCSAPFVTVLVALSMVYRGKTIIQWPRRFTLPEWSTISMVAHIGVPTGLQALLLNLGGAVLIRYIGSLENSAAAQAAYTIGYLQLFAVIMWVSFGLRVAASTMMGQNIGAGVPERGKRGVYVATAIGVIWAAFIGALFLTIPHKLLGLFGAVDPPLLEYGTNLLHFLAFSGILLVATLAFTGGLQGAGETRKPMYIAFFTQIIVLLGMCWGLQRLGLLTADAIWTSILISHALRFLITYVVFYRERWKGIVVEIVQPAVIEAMD